MSFSIGSYLKVCKLEILFMDVGSIPTYSTQSQLTKNNMYNKIPIPLNRI